MSETRKSEDRQQALLEESSGSLELRPDVAVSTGKDKRKAADGLERDMRWQKWTWPTWEHSPMKYENFWIQVWEDGSWKHGCTVTNQSRHSDWDVWVDLYVKNYESGTTAFTLAASAWFQDLDHGESYNKTAQGFSRDVYDLFELLYNGTLKGAVTTHKRRDN